MKRKDLLGLDGVSHEEITSILDTALNPDQLEVFHAAVVFDDFVRNAPQRALHGVFIHDFGFELEL